MSSKKLALLIALSGCAAASLIAGCAVGRETYGQFLNRKDATAHVTYYANGGVFETALDVKDIYYKPDSYVINLGVDELKASDITIEYVDYVFGGWHYAVTDDDGNLVYEDKDKNIVKVGEEVKFPYKIGDGERLNLCAVWTPDVKVEIRLASDAPITAKVDVTDTDGNVTTEDKKYSSGDVLSYKSFGKDSEIYLRSEAPVTCTDSTFVQFYEDGQCTKPFGGTASKPADGNLVLYAKYISGNWTVVKDKSGVTEMFTNFGLSSRKYYIINDIDCAGLAMNVSVTNCTIDGNGHTISNLVLNRTGIGNGQTFSVFGSFGASANIKNITFDNIKVTYSTRDNVFVDGLYLVCSGISSGAVFENFTVKNAEMSVSNADETSVIENIQKDGAGVYSSKNWIFGGGESDEDFTAAHGGIKVENVSLKVNGELIV